MSLDRLGFQEFVVFLAIAPHHRDRADLNFIIHKGSNYVLKPHGARFLILIQHVFTVGLLLLIQKARADNTK
jgi:hypothetical protein